MKKNYCITQTVGDFKIDLSFIDDEQFVTVWNNRNERFGWGSSVEAAIADSLENNHAF